MAMARGGLEGLRLKRVRSLEGLRLKMVRSFWRKKRPQPFDLKERSLPRFSWIFKKEIG
jgi:hypothetical protein